MAGETLSPNMNLVLPGVGVTPGPTYASDLNSSLTILDSHNHSAGSGVQITPNGMNISSDLSMGSNNLTLIRSLRLSNQGSPLALASDLGCVYESGGNLYFNNSTGGQVQITSGTSVNSGAGSITGMTAGVSVVYSAGVFTFQSAANVAANLDIQSIVLRNSSASSNGMTVFPPATMAADFTITLPTIPASGTKFVRMSGNGTDGAMNASVEVDSSTIEISTNVLQVKNSGITQPKLYTRTFAQSVAAGNVAANTGATQFSFTSTTLVDTGVNCTIVTTGRPVLIIIGAASGNTGQSGNNIAHLWQNNSAQGFLQVQRDGSEVWSTKFGYQGGSDPAVFLPLLQCVDVPSAASHVYTLFAYLGNHNGSTGGEAWGMALTAFEL